MIGMSANSMSANSMETTGVKDANLKLYHVMSVKQTLREDLAELHVVDALGQQEVPDYFQQPAKAITEDVSVTKGPQAQEWILAVFQKTGSL